MNNTLQYVHVIIILLLIGLIIGLTTVQNYLASEISELKTVILMTKNNTIEYTLPEEQKPIDLNITIDLKQETQSLPYGVDVTFETDPPIPITPADMINMYIDEICGIEKYHNVDPLLIQAMVERESSYRSGVTSPGNDRGLMQVNLKWHSERAERLGVKDIYDPYGNLLVGIDFISELITSYEHEELALMLYNMRWDTAFKKYKNGEISDYAVSILVRRDELKREE